MHFGTVVAVGSCLAPIPLLRHAPRDCKNSQCQNNS
jgi:hypothetical protein